MMKHETLYKDLKTTLNHMATFAFDHEDEFLKQFAKAQDVEDLVRVSWTEGSMDFVYVIESGQHLSDSVDISEWFKFMDKIRPLDERTTGRLMDGEYEAVWYSSQLQIVVRNTGYNFLTGEHKARKRRVCTATIKDGRLVGWRVGKKEWTK